MIITGAELPDPTGLPGLPGQPEGGSLPPIYQPEAGVSDPGIKGALEALNMKGGI